MSAPLTRAEIEAAFLAACEGELAALKPGNVHIHEAGHGMEVKHFQDAARAAMSHIADPALSVGNRILHATRASVAATGLNTNLGIVLLCAPLAKAAAETDFATGLRRRLATILSGLDVKDAVYAFEAIRIASAAGLGKVEQGDVTGTEPLSLTLIEAMHLAAPRDRIANAYVTAYSDVFDFALPVFKEARARAETFELAVTTLHMALLAEFPDSHVARKYGPQVAAALQQEARALRTLTTPVATPKITAKLAEFDRSLKARALNPGTTADFVVATLLTDRLSARKQP
jgi:triphosphoribosyl-dephospho-CoA synthase